ncbi:MAG: hypothetical protein AAGF73_18725 [Actinomycetota bacterium]
MPRTCPGGSDDRRFPTQPMRLVTLALIVVAGSCTSGSEATTSDVSGATVAQPLPTDAEAPIDAPTTTSTLAFTEPSTAEQPAPTVKAEPAPTIEAEPAVDGVPLVAFSDGVCVTQTITRAQHEAFTWQPFTRSREEGAAVHAVADPASGAAGPFAVILRLYESSRPTGGDDPVEIGGNQVYIRVLEDVDDPGEIGNGEAVWDLPDGSQGYLRSRGLNQRDIESIVTSLQPRPANDPLPGFDYDTDGSQPERLTLVAEGTNNLNSSAGYRIECALDIAAVSLTVVNDEGLLPYVMVIDRFPPKWVEQRNNAVLIGGSAVLEAPQPIPDQVVAVTKDQWQQLATIN